MKMYKIVAITQIHNELRKGHLERFFHYLSKVVDAMVIYDDASTDGSWEYAQKFTPHVIRGAKNDFANEWQHKKLMLEKALELKADFILSIDADEVVSDGDGSKLQKLASWVLEKDLDGARMRDVNLWRSFNWARTDNEFDTANFLRFWRVRPGIGYSERKPGLHQSPAPDTVQKVKDQDLVCLLHFGFATDKSIVAKYLTYAKYGQKGPNLSRLIDERELKLRPVDPKLFPHGLYADSLKPQARPLVEWLKLADELKPELLRPAVSIISLIYQSVKWLEFAYSQVLKYTDMSDKEFFFVANDATEDVKKYLKDNYIPHYIFDNIPEHKKEWYINNVYRAYNFGAQKACGDYVLFINSDMGFCPGWVEGLLSKTRQDNCVIGNLIGCGKFITSPPTVTKDFGQTLEDYREQDFLKYVSETSEDKLVDHRSCMPILVKKEDFLKVGGYPEGNALRGSDFHHPVIAKKGEDLISGDLVLKERLEEIGKKWQTSLLCPVYHFEQGEMTDFVEKDDGKNSATVAIVNTSLCGEMNEKVIWNFLLESLSGTQGVDINMVKDENNFEEKAKAFLVQNFPKLEIIIQNASFMDLINPSKFTIALLQDDLRRMGRSSLQQENNLDNAHLLVANTNFTAASYPEYNFEIIPVGVDDKLFCPGDKLAAKKRNAIAGEHVGIFVGSLTDVKGWLQVEKIIDRHQEITFIVVSKDEGKFTRPNVLMKNRIPQQQLADLYRCADFFILGSPVETECLAAIEACYTNVPVIMRQIGIFGDFTGQELGMCGIFGADFESALSQIFAKQFSPRKVMEAKHLNIETMLQRWWNLLAEVKEKDLKYSLAGKLITARKGQKKRNLRRKIRMILMNKTYLVVTLKKNLPRPLYNFLLNSWRFTKKIKRSIMN